MLELKEKDIISFYDDVQKIIQNLVSNITEQNIEEICNAAKQWLKQTDNNKSSIFLPLFILSMESLVCQRSASLLKNKVEPECGLSYLNGVHNNLSLEHGMWMLAMITMSWTIRNLKGKVEVGSCHNTTTHQHGAREPRLCSVGSQFHKKFYDECIRTFCVNI